MPKVSNAGLSSTWIATEWPTIHSGTTVNAMPSARIYLLAGDISSSALEAKLHLSDFYHRSVLLVAHIPNSGTGTILTAYKLNRSSMRSVYWIYAVWAWSRDRYILIRRLCGLRAIRCCWPGRET